MADLERLYKHRFSEEDRRRKDEIWQVLCADFFQRYVRPTDDVLEVAPGLGEFSRNIVARSKHAIDLNPESPSLLPKDIEFTLGSAERMAYPDAKFDVVFSSNFLEHLPNKASVENTLREIKRVLKPGGRYICLQPNIRFTYDRYWDFFDHHVALSDRSAAELFDNVGLEVEDLIPRFLPFTTKSALPTHPALVKLYLKVPLVWKLLGEQFLIVGRVPA